jgi:4,5-DOPA dioxygenase extradiol
MSARMPAVFVSHGSPMLSFQPQRPVHRFLREMSKNWSAPKAILMVSAHWETAFPTLGAAAFPTTIHDYGSGFPIPEMYTVQYPAPGQPAIAVRAEDLLHVKGFDVSLDPQRGFDHGCWSVLRLTYPAADIPVVQLSIQPHLPPEHHLAVGRALTPLRDEGVLIMASGTLVHNNRDIDRNERVPTPEWSQLFSDWFKQKLDLRDDAALIDYRHQAPFAVHCHPSDEHLLPIYVSLGAASIGQAPVRLHQSFSFSTQALDAYLFN